MVTDGTVAIDQQPVWSMSPSIDRLDVRCLDRERLFSERFE